MKVVKKFWTGAGGSPNSKVQAAVSIPIGKRLVIPFDAGSPEGMLDRLYVKQASGTNVGFTVRIQQTKITYGDGSGTPAAYNAAVTGNPELFDVVEPQTATSGNKAEFWDPNGSIGRTYQQLDAPSQTERLQMLYLVIIPTNTSDVTTWDVAISLARWIF